MARAGSTHKATLIGFLAIPIWALLPVLTVASGPIPPLELLGLTFTAGALAGFLFLALRPGSRQDLLRAGIAPVLFGTAGLFGFHFAYFLALQNAPALEANLINYLWPVLIVVFSAALPSRAGAGKLSGWHLAGVAAAFAGAMLAIGSGGALTLGGNAFGYGMALTAALIWSSYSVASRLFRSVPSTAVALYCACTALLAWCGHGALERFIWPAPGLQTAAIAALGIGPLGLAFYAWDYGCKHGDLRLLGVFAYFAPVLSTALLTLSGFATAKPALWLAALLITGGAIMASASALRNERRRGAPNA
jgi:drug/metabolite transporter (DMT)-like permease